MKKFIIGSIFGVLLATATSAHAEVTSLINKVVEGMFPVAVDGKSVGNAIVVDNKTYLPVREFGEAVGYKVTFTESREVVLTKNELIIDAKPTPQATTLPSGIQTTNEVKPIPIKKFKIGMDKNYEKENNDGSYIEIDGNKYVPAWALNNTLYTIQWSKPVLTFKSNDVAVAADVSINISESYSKDVPAFIQNGFIYVKLYALGLKATVNGDTLVIDKQ